MTKRNFFTDRISSRLLLLFLLVLLSSCAVKWIADYRKDIEAEIVVAAQKVDLYYADLIAVTEEGSAPAFSHDSVRNAFSKRVRQIDSHLYGIYLKNKARPLNDESTQIAGNILNALWRKYNGDLTTKKVLLEEHRLRFMRNFEALLQAEKVKEGTN
jgi:hypothetical protein